jgi:adenylate cyclase
MKKYLKMLQAKLPLIGITLVIVGICWGLLFRHYKNMGLGRTDIIYSLESNLLDARFRMRGAQKPKNKIGILSIDDKSLKQFGRWPFSRRYYERALNNLKAVGVSWIGFDAIFSEPEVASLKDAEPLISDLATTPKDGKKILGAISRLGQLAPGDELFSGAIERFGKLVTGFYYYENKSEVEQAGIQDSPFPDPKLFESSAIQSIIMPEGKELKDYDYALKVYGAVTNVPLIANASRHTAFFSNSPDSDAIVRWVSLVRSINGQLLPSLALKVAAESMNRDIAVFFNDFGVESIALVNRENDADTLEIPVDYLGSGRAILKHRGPGKTTFPYISLADAYNNNFTRDQKTWLKGASLFMGATAIGINDTRPNPFDSGLDGVENHAAMADNIISRDFMKRLPVMPDLEMKLVLAIGLIFGPILIFSRAIYAGAFTLCFIVAYFLFDKYYWFNHGIWAYMGMPYIEMASMFASIMLYKYATEEKERQKVKGAFGLYLSPDVIDQVLDDPEALSLGGQRKELTVFFSDVRGFTTISESLTPEALCDFMNEYFTPMTSIILRSKGVLDKYIGDAIMAFWGAPLQVDDQADIAVESSVKMLYALDELIKRFKEKGYPPIDIGIGLNTGQMSVGNMGSHERFTYTVMGDAVNLGSRLEGLTKDYGIKIMASEFTIARLKRPLDHFYRDLDDIKVKGKNEPVKVFDVMRPDLIPSKEKLRTLIAEFEQGRKAYREQDLENAEKHFLACLALRPDDGPSHVYIKRLAEMKKEGYIENWDGVTRFTHK